ncbi:hypothetical protein [Pseudomonas sp. NPDC089406]|uniref:hypothetical protein n=1 Tax=Pseudomonas sp. NPDC089406 TaxID=3364463 RepID=UPI00384DB2C8
MKNKWLCGVVGIGALLQLGCTQREPNTFTFVAEMPPGFAYWAGMNYVPEPGTECAVTDWRRTMPEINRDWQTDYSPSVEIEIRTVIKGCQMVLRHIEIHIFAKYGKQRLDFSYREANVGVYYELDEKHKRTFDRNGENVIYGECQWLFRTIGPKRVLTKLIECKKDNERGEKGKGLVFGAYLVEQLPGKTIRMNIRLNEEDRPYVKDTWVKVAGGWKRCLGEGMEDGYGFCRGDQTSFSEFLGVDHQVCTIYPGCKE